MRRNSRRGKEGYIVILTLNSASNSHRDISPMLQRLRPNERDQTLCLRSPETRPRTPNTCTATPLEQIQGRLIIMIGGSLKLSSTCKKAIKTCRKVLTICRKASKAPTKTLETCKNAWKGCS